MSLALSPTPREVGCHFEFDVADGGVTLVLQVAPSTGWAVRDEHLDLALDGTPVARPVTEVVGAYGTRLHVVSVGPGALTVDYRSAARPVASPVAPPSRGPADAIDAEALLSLRQSRYAPSDELLGFAVSELGPVRDHEDPAAAVASWVFERFAYTEGSSGPTDTAIDTIMSGAGVCRDFAHVTIALCRALEIPARLVSAYAPGLTPMDFHAVVEARVDGYWRVLDPTRLASRPSLVRIATGRDAADTAFVTTMHGEATLTGTEVWAVIEGDLPTDDHASPMGLV
jgi:transglutaminase-like putative cysteine protease